MRKIVIVLMSLHIIFITPIYSQTIDSIFQVNKPIIFKVVFTNDNLKLHSTSYVSFTATGKMWERDSTQMEIRINYNYEIKDSLEFLNYNNIGWVKEEITGARQDSVLIFIHPPRHNQFRLLEFAPFPNIELPLYKDYKYGRILSIGDGWGEYSNTKIESRYKVVEESENKTGKIWKITAESGSKKSNESPLIPICSVEMIFSQTEGYLSLDYKFYDGTRIHFYREK